MSRASLMADLQAFVGRKLNDCIDKIQTLARGHRYSVNVIDPEFNIGSIDNDESRLNVRQDGEGIIKSFSVG